MSLPSSDQLLNPQDAMPEAGRKIMLRYLGEMLRHEPIARAGDDIEGVHKMRVATRRLRTMYKIMGDYLSPSYQKPFPKQLRQTAAALGEVRDLDVFLENLNHYVTTQLNGDGTPLVELTELKQGQHAEARQTMLTYLDSDAYHSMVKNLSVLLQKPTEIDHLPEPSNYPLAPKLYRVDHALPLVILASYENIRRHETRFPLKHIPALHQIRIDCKRMRYALEAFKEVLGEYTPQLVDELKAVQDYLGELNDAAVAMDTLQVARAALPPDAHSGIEAYQKFWKKQLDNRLWGFPKVWKRFQRQQVHRWVMLNISKL